MSKDEQEHPKPPEAPDVKRKFQLYRFQIIGIPLIVLIPILALFGLFGESSRSVSEANEQLEVEVEYPTRFRYKMIEQASISIENLSGQPLSTVTVSFDRAYIDNFSEVTFTPDVKLVTDTAYIVELTDLQPQERQVIVIALQAEKYWEHEGEVLVMAPGAAPVQISLETFVFP